MSRNNSSADSEENQMEMDPSVPGIGLPARRRLSGIMSPYMSIFVVTVAMGKDCTPFCWFLAEIRGDNYPSGRPGVKDTVDGMLSFILLENPKCCVGQ